MPIINFDKEQRRIIANNWKHLKNVGKGTEADCYLDGNNVYKVYNDNKKDHCINNIICKDDLDLEHILFPNEIFKCDDEVFATRTKYIEENYFNTDHIYLGNTPDLDKLKKALEPFIKDIYELSNNYIYAKDLSLNTIFDGENLYAIDTLTYEKVSYNPYESNIELAKGIIELYIESYKFFYEELNGENKEFKDKCRELIPYIDELSNNIKDNSNTTIQRR